MSDPSPPPALQLAQQRYAAGDLAQAESLLRQILLQDPNCAAALHGLGLIAHRKGNHQAAAELLSQAIDLEPANAAAICNLGTVYESLARAEDAIACFRRSLLLKEDALTHYNLASVLQRSGRNDEATASFRAAIGLKPDYTEAYNNLGRVLEEQGRLEEAIACWERALTIKPDHVPALMNLGSGLQKAGKIKKATEWYRRTLQLQPDLVDAHIHLADALEHQGKIEEAIVQLNRALSIDADVANAHNNLGNLLREQGLLDEAIFHFRRAIELAPQHAGIHSNLIYNLYFHPASTLQSLLKESQAWAKQHADPLASEIQPHCNDLTPNRRLKIGYVSPDFRFHAAASFLLPLLSHHDPQEVEVFCYSSVLRPDAMTHRLRNLAHQWRDVASLSDAQLSEQIRSDRIDILVDLTLHMAHNRLLTFARKPAPIQVTWLGYPGTTGLSSIDYRLTDPYLDPPGQGDEFYSERSIRLPHTFWCYQPTIDTPQVNPLPALSNGYITFGCFNNFAKVTNEALRLWIEVLRVAPDSRLLLLSWPGSHRDRIRRQFECSAIARDRLEFLDRVSPKDFFALHHHVDICLDPIPYPGHTTTLDALWMGVPVVTLCGNTAVSRGGASILSNLGLPELVAHTPTEYVSIAANWAGNPAGLVNLRATVRERMKQSKLMDAKHFAADLEAIYRKMWRDWCARRD